MHIRPLDEALSASPQIALEDLPAIAAQGFRSVISNRPDGEEPGQLSAEALRQAAEAAKSGCPVSKVLNADISLDVTVA